MSGVVIRKNKPYRFTSTPTSNRNRRDVILKLYPNETHFIEYIGGRWIWPADKQVIVRMDSPEPLPGQISVGDKVFLYSPDGIPFIYYAIRIIPNEIFIGISGTVMYSIKYFPSSKRWMFVNAAGPQETRFDITGLFPNPESIILSHGWSNLPDSVKIQVLNNMDDDELFAFCESGNPQANICNSSDEYLWSNRLSMKYPNVKVPVGQSYKQAYIQEKAFQQSVQKQSKEFGREITRENVLDTVAILAHEKLYALLEDTMNRFPETIAEIPWMFHSFIETGTPELYDLFAKKSNRNLLDMLLEENPNRTPSGIRSLYPNEESNITYLATAVSVDNLKLVQHAFELGLTIVSPSDVLFTSKVYQGPKVINWLFRRGIYPNSEQIESAFYSQQLNLIRAAFKYIPGQMFPDGLFQHIVNTNAIGFARWLYQEKLLTPQDIEKIAQINPRFAGITTK